MTKNPEGLYWKKFPEWYVVKNNVYVLLPGAPDRVVKSFKLWKKMNPEYFKTA